MTPDAAKEWANEAGLKLIYDADLAQLSPLGVPFTRLALDDETASYLGAATTARHGRLMTWLHRSLRPLLSDFDINGYLGTYPMHVLSTAQWESLLAQSSGESSRDSRLLDVGAGRGDATSKLSPLFSETLVTETSPSMARRLRKQGYDCLEGDISLMDHLDGRFDAVSLLNVLDRCDRPLSLLGKARCALKPHGLLLIALVLPYQPFVYDAGQARPPRERLPIKAREWELSAVQFVNLCLTPLGLKLKAISRAPYLSGGDSHCQLYELDDLILVMQATSELSILGTDHSREEDSTSE